MKTVGHTSKFLFGIYWWTWKTTVYLKKLLKWANKKCKNFNIYNIAFFKKNKEVLMIWSTVLEIQSVTDFWVIFCPFTLTPKNPTNKNFEKVKQNYWRHHHFTYVYQKPQLYEIWFLRYGVRQGEIFVILGHFLPFYPLNNPEIQNFEKMEKASGDVISLHISNKNRKSYNICFLRHGVPQT